MSAKSSRSDYIILGTLGLCSAVVILLLILYGWLATGRERAVVRTSHSCNVEGTVVAHVLFERVGMPMQRSEHLLLSDTLDEFDVVLLIDPIFPLGQGEGAALRNWIRAGGLLICSGWDDELNDIHGIRRSYASQSEAMLERLRRYGRSELPEQLQDPVKGAAVGTLARDVNKVSFASSRALDSDASDPGRGNRGPVEELLLDDGGLRIAERIIGDGRVIVIADSSFMANGRIGKADNAVLATNLVAYARYRSRGTRAAYDEYHFGFGSRPTGRGVMASMLFTTSPGWAVLSLSIAGVLFLFYKGRRFGTRRGPGRTRRRSKLEYVHSVGATYRSAGAHRLAARLIYQWFRRRVAWLTGLSETASIDEIASCLARRTGKPQDHYAETLRGCEQALAASRLSARQTSELIEQLAEIESEVFDGHQSRK